MLPQQSQASLLTDLIPVASYSCDETSGPRADSTTNALDLTDNNTVGYAPGLVGNACDFESTNSEYLSHSDNANLEPGNSYSWSFWIKQESDTDGALLSKWNNSSNGFWLLSSSPGSDMNFTDEDQNANFFSAGVTDNVWNHYVFTYAASTLILYKDGSQIDTSSFVATVGDGSDQFQIGKVQFFNSNYFDGLIDQIDLFDYELSSTEVYTLYNGGVPLVWDGSTDSGPATSTPSTTPSTSNNGDLVFLLSVIIFFLATIWIGMLVSSFRNRK